ncbi:MAG: preprotein translocase subunit YajC [Magnetovibrionaceae bacterium]
MFVSPAYAQAAGGAGGSGLEALIPLVLIFVVFYFLLIRPQQKKMKQHKAMLEAVRRGDKIVTGGGIIGTVTKVTSDEEVQVEIADGIKVRVQRSMIAAVLDKTEPVKDDKKSESKSDDAANGAANDDADEDKEAAAQEKAGSKLKGLFGGKKD